MTDVMKAWIMLLYLDILMRSCGFQRIHEVIRERRVKRPLTSEKNEATLLSSVDLACVFYFKRVLCLQRSAAAVLLLRSNGWNAQMVIGAKLLPFQSHAWVEIGGQVVNDKPYIREMFQVLECC